MQKAVNGSMTTSACSISTYRMDLASFTEVLQAMRIVKAIRTIIKHTTTSMYILISTLKQEIQCVQWLSKDTSQTIILQSDFMVIHIFQHFFTAGLVIRQTFCGMEQTM